MLLPRYEVRTLLVFSLSCRNEDGAPIVYVDLTQLLMLVCLLSIVRKQVHMFLRSLVLFSQLVTIHLIRRCFLQILYTYHKKEAISMV